MIRRILTIRQIRMIRRIRTIRRILTIRRIRMTRRILMTRRIRQIRLLSLIPMRQSVLRPAELGILLPKKITKDATKSSTVLRNRKTRSGAANRVIRNIMTLTTVSGLISVPTTKLNTAIPAKRKSASIYALQMLSEKTKPANLIVLLFSTVNRQESKLQTMTC